MHFLDHVSGYCLYDFENGRTENPKVTCLWTGCFSEKDPIPKMCPSFADVGGPRVLPRTQGVHPEDQTCVNCSLHHPLALVVQQLTHLANNGDDLNWAEQWWLAIMMDLVRGADRRSSGPVWRRSLLLMMVILGCHDHLRAHCAPELSFSFTYHMPETFQTTLLDSTLPALQALTARVVDLVSSKVLVALLPYVERATYLQGDVEPVYVDHETGWTWTVTHVPTSVKELEDLFLQDVIPPLRLAWMSCVTRCPA